MNKVVFVPHCILNQSVRALGKESQCGQTKEIVKFFAEAEIGIVQMPCPEAESKGKSYQKVCREISIGTLRIVKDYLERGYEVLGILGVEFSPTCGVHRIESKSKIVPGKGILTQELEKAMQEHVLARAELIGTYQRGK